QLRVQLATLDVPLEAAAVHVLHDHVVLGADSAVFVGANDVDVVQPLRDLGLAVEAPYELGVRHELLHGDLEGHDLAVGLAAGAVDAGHAARPHLLEQLVARDLGVVETGRRGGARCLRGGLRPLALGRSDTRAAHHLNPGRDDEPQSQRGEDERRQGTVHATQHEHDDCEAGPDDEEDEGQPRGRPQQNRDKGGRHGQQHDRHSSTSAMMSVMLSGPPRSFASAMSASTDSCLLLELHSSAWISSGDTRPWRPSVDMTNTSPFSTVISMTSGATCGRVPSTLVMRLRHSWLLASSSLMRPLSSCSSTHEWSLVSW